MFQLLVAVKFRTYILGSSYPYRAKKQIEGHPLVEIAATPIIMRQPCRKLLGLFLAGKNWRFSAGLSHFVRDWIGANMIKSTGFGMNFATHLWENLWNLTRTHKNPPVSSKKSWNISELELSRQITRHCRPLFKRSGVVLLPSHLPLYMPHLPTEYNACTTVIQRL